MDKIIVIIFSEQNFFNFKWDKSTGIKSSTKLYYSLSDKYRAEKHDLNTKKQTKHTMKYLKYLKYCLEERQICQANKRYILR